jgi:hypothetical protein
MSDSKQKLPGNGFLGWLGRQVGHVTKAVKTDVTRPVPAATIVHRTDRVDQVPHPTLPGVTLRRTTVDEVVVHTPSEPS